MVAQQAGRLTGSGNERVARSDPDRIRAHVAVVGSGLAARFTKITLAESLMSTCANCMTIQINCVTIQTDRTYDCSGSTILHTVSLESCSPSSIVAVKTWPQYPFSRIRNRPFSASKILMQFAHEVRSTQNWVGSTENGVLCIQREMSYTHDRIWTLMDTPKNQMCELAVAEI